MTAQSIAEGMGQVSEGCGLFHPDFVCDQGVDVAPSLVNFGQFAAPAIREAQQIAAGLGRVDFASYEPGLDQPSGHRAHAGRGQVERPRDTDLRRWFHVGQRIKDARLTRRHVDQREAATQRVLYQSGRVQEEVKLETISFHANS